MNLGLPVLRYSNMGENITSAGNQQGTRKIARDSSETTSQAPLPEEVIKAYLLGSLHDGTYSCNNRYRFSQKGKQWLKVLQKLLSRLSYNSWIYREGATRNVYVLETLADFLDFGFNPLVLNKNEEKAAYVRGFFDAEGGIPRKRKARFYVQLVQNDKGKLKKIKKLLNDLHINTDVIHNPSKSVDPDYWRLYVLSNSLTKFVRGIGTWHPRKIRTIGRRMKI